MGTDMADKAAAKIRYDDFVAAVHADPAKPEPTIMLFGFIGNGDGKGIVRIYPDPTLNRWYDVAEADIVHVFQISDSPLGGSYAWVRAGAEIKPGVAGAAAAPAAPAAAEAGAAQARAAAVPAPAISAVNVCTLPAICQATPNCPTHFACTQFACQPLMTPNCTFAAGCSFIGCLPPPTLPPQCTIVMPC
jgi:hypothetical protein